jgi:large subunit ribosomal protein L24
MSQPKLRIKRDDTVVVVAGKDRGTTGRVLRVIPEKGKLVVEGVNRVVRHVKPAGDQPGSIVRKEAPIHSSNVALWDAAENRRVKVSYGTDDNGRKIRVDRKTGAPIDKD